MKKKTLILFLIIIVFVTANAQTVNKDSVKIAKKETKKIKKAEKKASRKARNRYLLINFARGISKMKEQTVSPLLYKGGNTSFGFSYLRLEKRKINYYDFNLSTASLDLANKDITQGSPSILYKPSLNFYSLYGIADIHDKVFFYFGWHLFNNSLLYVNSKYMNSALVFSFFSETGVTGRIDLPFSWKAKTGKFLFIKTNRKDRKLRLSWMFGLPVFSHVLRPEYAGITNFVDGKSSLSINPGFAIAGQYIYFDSKLELLYELGNYNLLKLSYNWDFLHYSPDYNKVQAANHYFNLSFVIKLNKHQKSINYVKEVKND